MSERVKKRHAMIRKEVVEAIGKDGLVSLEPLEPLPILNAVVKKPNPFGNGPRR